MSEVSRYHPLLVTLHWLLAVLIIGMVAFGFLVLATTMNTSPQKPPLLQAHMIGGGVILLLMLLRLVVRLMTPKPPPSRSGSAFLDGLARVVHYGFYLLVFVMAGSGIALSVSAGLPDILFGGSGQPLPPDFGVYPPMAVHAITGLLLALFILLHIAGALYHTVIRKDGLLRRMGFGGRAAVTRPAE